MVASTLERTLLREIFWQPKNELSILSMTICCAHDVVWMYAPAKEHSDSTSNNYISHISLDIGTALSIESAVLNECHTSLLHASS